MPCTGHGSTDHPEYVPALCTPPVALTDGLLCEFEGLAFLLWKLKRTVWSKGKRSRNKASVGEPADGSLRCLIKIFYIHKQKNKKTKKKNKKNKKKLFLFFFF